MITGITSKKANEYNNKFKNKSLTILGITITLGAMIIGTTTILLVMDIRKGTLAIGTLFLIVVIMISIYMRKRVGIEIKKEK